MTTTGGKPTSKPHIRTALGALTLLALGGAGAGCADVCDTEEALEGSYFIKTNADVDGLAGKKCINGSLIIGEMRHDPEQTGTGIQGDYELSDGVSSLVGLETLEIVEGDVHIAGNRNLASLEGLSGLTHVGRELRFEKNPRGDLIVHQNAVLTDLDGLSALFLVGANLVISANDVLTDIDGMAALERVGWELKVIDNPSLDTQHVRDFGGRVSALGDLVVSGNGGDGGGS